MENDIFKLIDEIHKHDANGDTDARDAAISAVYELIEPTDFHKENHYLNELSELASKLFPKEEILSMHMHLVSSDIQVLMLLSDCVSRIDTEYEFDLVEEDTGERNFSIRIRRLKFRDSTDDIILFSIDKKGGR